MVTFAPEVLTLNGDGGSIGGGGQIYPSSTSTSTPPPASSGDEISGMFSYLSNRPSYQQSGNCRWSTFSSSSNGANRSLWTKYCLLCTLCGSAATILAGIFLVVAALFRHYTTSINYFETVPTYMPAILLSICGICTIAFSCKRNRNIILLRITACWSLCSAALSSVITITTSLIHMNRLQTLKECVYQISPPGCSCYSHVFGIGGAADGTGVTYVFENTPDCEVIHGILYSCLRAVFAISIVAVLLSIFLCMLLYQLIGHERKKAYWSRIRRINSDWSADFIACLTRPMPREQSNLLPLVISPSSTMSMVESSSIISPAGWGPPPPYQEIADEGLDLSSNHRFSWLPNHNPHRTEALGQGQRIRSGRPQRALRFVNSRSVNSFRSIQSSSDALNPNPHPFSPTITSIDPIHVFRQHQELSRSYSGITATANANSNANGMGMESSSTVPMDYSMSSITLSNPSPSSTYEGDDDDKDEGVDELEQDQSPGAAGPGSISTVLQLPQGQEPLSSETRVFGFGPKRIINSLPCSPLLNTLRRKVNKKVNGKSVQNLSFANRCYQYDDNELKGTKDKTKGGDDDKPLKKKQESCICFPGVDGVDDEINYKDSIIMKGTSLPSSPIKRVNIKINKIDLSK